MPLLATGCEQIRDKAQTAERPDIVRDQAVEEPNPAHAGGLPTGLSGDWVVKSVSVAPCKVCAVGDDEPAFMGAIASFSPQEFRWRKPARPPYLNDERCIGPSLSSGPSARSVFLPEEGQDFGNSGFPLSLPDLPRGLETARSYQVTCASGSWGEGRPLLVLSPDRLVLHTYEGALLFLSPAEAGR